MSVVDANKLALGTVNTSGDLLLASHGGLDFGTSNIGGNLNVSTGGGNITQSGPLSIKGSSTFNAGTGSVALTDPNNLFLGKLTVDAAVPTISSSPPAIVQPRPVAVAIVSENDPAVAPEGGLDKGGAESVNTSLVLISNNEVNVGGSGGSHNGFTRVHTFAKLDIATGIPFSFVLPEDTFQHTVPKGVVTLDAHTEDGAILPTWLNFEPKTGRFSGVAPKNIDEIILVITAHDNSENEASTKVTLQFE